MKKYCITLLHCSGEIEARFWTDSPTTAINKWLSYNVKSPCMANISCGSVNDCMELYKDFLNRRYVLYRDYWERRKIRLNFKYIVDSCTGYLCGKNLHFLGSKDFYDSVPVFCYG